LLLGRDRHVKVDDVRLSLAARARSEEYVLDVLDLAQRRGDRIDRGPSLGDAGAFREFDEAEKLAAKAPPTNSEPTAAASAT
jgi:hypothetical protein